MGVHVVRLEAPVAKHELRGFGGQFDSDLFTARGQPNPVSPAQLAALRRRIRRLEPGLSRIFVTSRVFTDKEEHEALMKTIRLAQSTGADVNLTWWHGPYFRGTIPKEKKRCEKRTKKAVTGKPGQWPFIGDELMAGFARIIEEARKSKLDCVKQVTIQNEVNAHDIGLECSAAVSKRLYRRLYTILDRELKSRPDPLGLEANLRETVDFVGGDLVMKNRKGISRSDQDHWLRYMRSEMTVRPSKLLDGYSIHVYWGPPEVEEFNFRFIEKRMNGLRTQIRVLDLDLPVHVTEYGVKSSPNRQPGTRGGKNMEDTVLSGFEHAWLNALAPQCGCVGLVKWALYRTDGPDRRFKGWGMIPPPKDAFEPLSPTYFVTLLFNSLIDVPGWKAAGLWRSRNTLLLASRFAAVKGGDHAFVALNRGPAATLQFRNLKPKFEYFSVVWNRRGDSKPGTLRRRPPVVTSARRMATVSVRTDEVVAFSTRPIRI